MTIKISDISGYTKFINTKYVDDIKPIEEPTIDAEAVLGAYTDKQRQEASEKWHEAHEAMLAAQKAAIAAAKAAAEAAAKQAAFDEAAAAATLIGSDECPPGYLYDTKTGDCVKGHKGSGPHYGAATLGAMAGTDNDAAFKDTFATDNASNPCPPGYMYNAKTGECIMGPQGGKKKK